MKKQKTKPVKNKKPKVKETKTLGEPKETEQERYKREIREEQERKDREDRAYRILQPLKRRDLVREVILRGLPFEKVGESTPFLARWLTDNLDNGQDENFLTEYDAWVEGVLRENGTLDENRVLLHPDLRFGTISRGVWDNSPAELPGGMPLGIKEGKKSKEEKKPKKEKKIREKDAAGLVSGTKKSLTYSLVLARIEAGKKVNKDSIIDKVLESFPDANMKSIEIWIKRAMKSPKEE